MPPKRGRAKKEEPSTRSKQSEASTNPPKRRKQQEDDSVSIRKVSNGEELKKEKTGNGKTAKSRKKREIAAPSKKAKKSRPPPAAAIEEQQKDEEEEEKVEVETSKVTNKKETISRKKGAIKSRPKNRPRQDDDVVVVQKPITHFSHHKIPGSVLVMGQGDFGQLGIGESMTERKKPYPVKGELSDKEVIQVECGGMHSVALTADGKVYTWGCNDEGSLGYSVSEGETFHPCKVDALDEFNIVQITAGDCHTCALVDTGKVFCWGVFRDSNGPFGTADSSPSTKPQVVYNSSFNPAIKIASGDNHVIILTEKGDIYTFGSGEQGQLGRIPEVFCSRGGRQGLALFFTPQTVRLSKRRDVKMPEFCDIFAGGYNSFAVAKEKNSVYAWGLNNYGQLGVGTTDIKLYPEKVPEDWLWCWAASQSDSNAKKHSTSLSIAAGMHHTLVAEKGDVYSMGSENYGRLGLGKINKETDKPAKITGLKDIVSVACGGSCSFAVSSKGDVFSWGMGSTLQLGQGDDGDYWEPSKVTGKNLESKKVVGVSIGGQHTALLVTNETDE